MVNIIKISKELHKVYEDGLKKQLSPELTSKFCKTMKLSNKLKRRLQAEKIK